MLENTVLQGLLPKVKYWASCGASLVATTVVNGVASEYPFSIAEIAGLHPDLPEAIQGIISHNKSRGLSNFAKGSNVVCSLRLLNQNVFHFIDRHGETQVSDFPLEFKRTAQYKDQYILFADSYTLGEVLKGSTIVPFVSAHRKQSHDVHVSDLNRRYPGWEVRWEVCAELYASVPELMAVVFPVALVPIHEHTPELPVLD